MDHENNIDRQGLASILPGPPHDSFRIYDTHAAGRLDFGPGGGRLNPELLGALSVAIPRWNRQAVTYCVIMGGGDPFCTGWDMPSLLRGDPSDTRACLAQSYTMAWQLECFTKPTIPLIDGLLVGAGVAYSLYGTHRVAGERYRFAVPGPQEGWFPDHGLSHVLALLPGFVGTYIALTGASLGRADARRLGLVTHCIGAQAFSDIIARLSDADPVDPILDGLDEGAPSSAGDILAHAQVIERCFSADSVEEILARLAAVTGRDIDWARAAHAAIASTPRLPAALTLRLLRENRHGDLREALIRDYAVASRLLGQEDRMSAAGPVAPQTLAHMLASLGPEGLRLATRAEMQAPAL